MRKYTLSLETRERMSKSKKGIRPKNTYGWYGKDHPRWTGGKPRCLICGKLLSRKPYKYCRIHSIRHIKKDEESPYWKGNKVTYRSLHVWVVKKLGQPKKCKHCGTVTAKKYDWANISHLYKRELNDWIRLCRSCHIKFDESNLKQIETKKLKRLI